MIALDLGTRSIICAEHEGDIVRRVVLAEHKSRAMQGGNIYDFGAAVENLRQVRERMGLAAGTPVSLAIAGGQLFSKRFTVNLAGPGPWSETDLAAAEKEAARDIVASRKHGRQVLLGIARAGFTCAGRAVGSLVGMEGENASYEALATYLPLDHVKLKARAVAAAGFAPERITVEPLAISAALFGGELPPSLIALIDIGAGTSDIALIGADGLLGVTSVPFAGDTITDAVARAFGLAYLAADAVKRDPGVTVTDLWGASQQFTAERVRAAAQPGFERLIAAVADALKGLLTAAGQKKLAGIILVGGGSLWPGLPAALAEAAGVDEDRVRIRAAESIGELKDESGELRGPVFVTVAGIIRSYARAFMLRHFVLNEEPQFLVRHSGDAAFLSVADCLRETGTDPLDLFGRPGAAIVQEDGRILGGGAGDAPRVTVNGRVGSLDDAIGHGDRVTVAPGADGEDARPLATASLEGTAGITKTEEESAPTSEAFLHGLRQDGRFEASPERRTLRIQLNGEWRTITDRSPVSPRSAADTRPWRLYEALAGLPSAVRLLVNDAPATYVSEIRDNDRVTAS